MKADSVPIMLLNGAERSRVYVRVGLPLSWGLADKDLGGLSPGLPKAGTLICMHRASARHLCSHIMSSNFL